MAMRCVAKIGASPNDSLGSRRRAFWVAAGLCVFRNMPRWAPPIGAPFPDVADHVVKAVSIGFKATGGCCAQVAIVCRIDLRELSLPDVASMFPQRGQLVAPGVGRIHQTASCRCFPLSFRWQFFASPSSKRGGIVPRHMNDRVVKPFDKQRAWPVRRVPASAFHWNPPGCQGNG